MNDPRLKFQQGDAQALPAESSYYNVVVSGLVLNFIPNPAAAVAEMIRSVKPGGTIAVYVWDYAGDMQMLRYFWDAAALDPAAKKLDEGERFPLCHPNRLEQLFTAAGLNSVEVKAIDAPTVFKNFDDYWSLFLGGKVRLPAMWPRSTMTGEPRLKNTCCQPSPFRPMAPFL